MSNSLASSQTLLKASSYKKVGGITPDNGALLGYVIVKAESEEYLFCWRKTAFSNLCEWVRMPSVAKIYKSAELAFQDAAALPYSDSEGFTVRRLYDVNSQFFVV